MTSPTSNYTTAASAAADTGFQNRVRASLFSACIRIESGTFTNANQKAYYSALVNNIIATPDRYVTVFAWMLTANKGLTTASLDSDIDTAVNAVWPTVSGYSGA